MKIQKKKLSSIFLSLVMMVAMSFFCFVGCTSNFSFDGKFTQPEIVLSVGDSLNPSDYFNSEMAAEFVSADKTILQPEGDGFVAKKEGKTQILAKSAGLLIDSVNVYVKYTFLTPSNLAFSPDGILTWDEGSLFLDGKVVRPSYRLTISKDGVAQPERTTQTPYLAFSDSGSYTVQIMSMANDRARASDFCEPFTFVFDSLEAPAVSFQSDSAFGSQTGKLTWQGEDASLVVDGLAMEGHQGEQVLDFSAFDENESVEIAVSLNDGAKKGKSISTTIQKLATPNELDYEEGLLSWDGQNKRAIAFEITSGEGDITYFSENSNMTDLGVLPQGLYSVRYQAIGQTGFANGNIKEISGLVGKLGNVTVESKELIGKRLRVTFSTENLNIQKFKVYQNELSAQEFEFSQEDGGKRTQVCTFDLVDGENRFYVQAIPFENATIEQDGQSSSYVLQSGKELFYTVYNLEEISNLKHSLEGANSVLSFDSVPAAETYKVSINGQNVEGLHPTIAEGKVSIDLGMLSQPDQVEIVVTATRQLRENELIIDSTSQPKTLKRLPAASLQQLNGEAVSGNRYTWAEIQEPTADRKVARYSVNLYKSNSQFNQNQPAQNSMAEEPQTEELGGGDYVIEVQSYPLESEEDRFLPSLQVASDKFYVAQKIDAPLIRFDEAPSAENPEITKGYYLTIQTVENGYKYEIFVDDKVDGALFSERVGEKIYYQFAEEQNFAKASTKIEVKVSTKDDEKLHPQSDASTIVVERLKEAEEYSLSQDAKQFTLTNQDLNAVIEVYKNDQLFASSNPGEDLTIDLENLDGAFEFTVIERGYQNFEEFTQNGIVKLTSLEKTYSFQRSVTPRDLNYSKGEVTFSHDDENGLNKATSYVVSVLIKTINGSSASGKLKIDAQARSFILKEEIQKQLLGDEVFASAYENMASATISLYAEIATMIDGKIYLSSRNALVKNSADTSIEIKKSQAVKLEYLAEENKLVWDGVEAPNPIYRVYFNDSPVGVGSERGDGKFEFDISNRETFDFTKEGDYGFYVVVESERAFDSDKSKQIIFHRLSSVKELHVFEENGKYVAQLTLASSELDHITVVELNGENIIESAVAGSITIALEGQTENYSIVVRGEDFENLKGDRIFYLDSDTTSFQLSDVALQDYRAQISVQNGQISWSWNKEEPRHVLYDLEVFNSAGTVVKISGLSTKVLSLSDERLLGLAESIVRGEYTLRLHAFIDSYIVLNGAHEHFGRCVLNESQTIEKLAKVESLSATLTPASEVSLDAERRRQVVLSWEYGEHSGQNFRFEIFVNGSYLNKTTENTFAVEQSALLKDYNEIIVYAVDDNNLRSEGTKIVVQRFTAPIISMNDDGKLEIQSEQTLAEEGYLIEITLGGESKTFEIENAEPQGDGKLVVDMLNRNFFGRFAQKDGLFHIRLIHRGTQGIVLSAMDDAQTAGTMLSAPSFQRDGGGLHFAAINDEEVVNIELLNDLGEVTESYSTSKNEKFYFEFPESWGDGDYTLRIYASRTGLVDSYKGSTEQITISRVKNAESVQFARKSDFLDYVLSWENENAQDFEFEIFSQDTLIGNVIVSGAKTINLSEIVEKIDGMEAGEYVFKFRSLVSEENASQNSLPNTHSFRMQFNVTKGDTSVSDIRETNAGILTFSANDNEFGFAIVIKNGEKELIYKLGKNERSVLVSSEDPDFSGVLAISIVQLGSAENISNQIATDGQKISVDSAPVQTEMQKLKIFESLSVEIERGMALVRVAEESVSNRQFYVSTISNGITRLSRVPQESVTRLSNTEYGFLLVDLCSLLTLEVDEEGKVNISIFSYDQGKLRSEKTELRFSYSQALGDVESKKIDELNDYLVVYKDWEKGAEDEKIGYIYLKVRFEGQVKNYAIDVNEVKGYWTSDGESETFSVESTSPQSKGCYAINMTNLLANLHSGTITVQLGYLTQSGKLVDYCKRLDYYKLNSPINFAVERGNLKWRGNTSLNSGYVIYLKDRENGTYVVDETIFVRGKDEATYYGENIQKAGSFYASISAISAAVGFLPSPETYIAANNKPAEVKKLPQIQTNLSLENGILSLEFNDERNKTVTRREDIDSIETFLNSQESIFGAGGDAANFLTTNNFSYPFDFVLNSLRELKFNLKFVTNQDGHPVEYLTTVKAVNLLSALKPQTMQKLETFYNNQKEQNLYLKNVMDLFGDKNLFLGVASSSLLFDEIGEDETGLYGKFSANSIPAGEYDVYIQQQGPENSNDLSSIFTKVLSNAKIIDSPTTRAKQTVVDQKNIYSITFAPVPKGDGQYDDYVLTFKDKTYGTIIDYQIKYADGTWTRTAFPKTEAGFGKVTLPATDGLVEISLNGENGLIFEEGVEDIHGRKTFSLTGEDTSIHEVKLQGNSFIANIYAKGSSTEFNGKTTPIDVTFLSFDIEGLKLNDGRFEWSNFALPSGQSFATTMKYLKYGESNPRESEKNESGIVTWMPEEEGKYNYISFATLGKASLFTIWVDSPTYTLNNVYKLSTPDVKVVDGKIVATAKDDKFNNLSVDTRVAKNFLLSNDAPNPNNSISIEVRQDGGKFELVHETGVNTLNEVKSAEAYKYGLSEQAAHNFYVAIAGHSGQFDALPAQNHDFDISLQGVDGTVLLRSEQKGTPAQKLETTKNAKISAGDVTWSGVSGNDADSKIVYEVSVSYFKQTAEAANEADEIWEEEIGTRRVFYTTNTILPGQILNDPNNQLVYKYIVDIRAKLYSLTDQGQGSIKTLENETYYVKVQEEQNQYVLNGELSRLGYSIDQTSGNIMPDKLLRRSEQVAIETFKIVSGIIEWNYADADKHSFTVYKQEGGNMIPLDGDVKIVGEKCQFIPNPENSTQLVSGREYQILVTAYLKNNGTIKSRLSTLSDSRNSPITVRVLPLLTKDDYVADRQERHMIDFSNYFTKASSTIAPGNLTIKLDGTIGSSQKVSETVTNANRVWEFEGESASVEAIAVPTDSVNNVLRPYIGTKLDFNEPKFAEDDFYIFDEESQVFKWTYGAEKRKMLSEDAPIYLQISNDGVTTYRLIGVAWGEHFTDQQMGIDKDRMWPIVFNDHQSFVKIEDTDVTVEENVAYATATKQTNIYDKVGEEYQIAGTLEIGERAPLTYKQWKLNYHINQTGVDGTYYLPLIAIETNGNQFIATGDYTLYEDENCTKPVSLKKGMDINPEPNEDNPEYVKIPLSEILHNQTEGYLYIQKDFVQPYLRMDSSMADKISTDVAFRVQITTTYSYMVGANSYEERSTRTYNNIALGEKSVEKLGEFVMEGDGVYVTTFAPNLLGKIEKVSIQARVEDNNLLSMACPAHDENSTYDFNLFGSFGEGTDERPYQISKAEQFENISYRLSKPEYLLTYTQTLQRTIRYSNGGQQQFNYPATVVDETKTQTIYHFKQTDNLTFTEEGFKIKGSFVGIYDGGNKNIDVTSVAYSPLSVVKTAKLAVGNGSSAVEVSRDFAAGAGLFEEIGEESVIENLSLSPKLVHSDRSGMGDQNVLVGGLAASNKGTIRHITVTADSDQITFENALSTGTAFAFANVVAFNEGTIEDVKANLNVLATNPFVGSQNFYYGGVSGFNTGYKATLVGINSKGSIGISLTSSGSDSSVVAAGVALSATYGANVSACLNEADITLSSKGGTSTAAGVIVYASDYGTAVTACANTGSINSRYGGGVMFYFRAINFSSLIALGKVNEANQNLIGISASQGTATGKNYSYPSYNPGKSAWRCEELPSGETILPPSGQYRLQATRSGDVFNVTLIKGE